MTEPGPSDSLFSEKPLKWGTLGKREDGTHLW